MKTKRAAAWRPDPASVVLQIVEEVANELHPGQTAIRATLDSRLDRDLRVDSLGRAELLLRVERAFAVSLPEHTLGQAETPRDLLTAILARQSVGPLARSRSRRATTAPLAVPEPVNAETLCAVLDWHAEHHGDRVHIRLEQSDEQSSAIAYGTLAKRARRAACGLRELDVAAGDRVAIMLPTSDAFFVAFFAALYAGAVPVPIYPPARASQIEEHLRRQTGILDNAEAKILIAPEALHSSAKVLRSLVRSLNVVASLAGLPAGTAHSALPRIDQPNSTALLQYTSGSTGDPKGVMLSHANLLANIRAIGAAMRASASDIFVSWLPLYHDMGLIAAWLGSLYYGAPFVAMPPHRFLARPARWLWAIHRHRGTLSAAPNFAFEMCLRNISEREIGGLDLSSLRLVANGSEPVSAATLRRFINRFGRYGYRPEAMAPAYGLAENTVSLTLPLGGGPPLIDRISRRTLAERAIAAPVSEEEPAIELVSCGQPLAGHEIRVVDDRGRELDDRREGRLQFRGPSATCGYFRNPQKTRELFSGDWLDTGDLAYTVGGNLFVTGRSKDIIIRAGRHIYPSEIEACSGDIPGLQRGGVVAFGSPDPRSGTERLVILAETRAPEDQHPDLKRQIAAATIAIADAPPEDIVLVKPRTVPKTTSGKLRRAAARQLYESGELGRRRSLRQQILALWLSAQLAAMQRLERRATAFLFAAYWWTVMALLAAIGWILAVGLPRLGWRWTGLRIVTRMGLSLTGTGLAVEQHGTLPRPAIIVSNHQSYLDGLALAAALPGELRFVAKRELLHQPIARLALKALGTLFVERSDIEQGVEDVRRAAEAARSGARLVFFPEGALTRAVGLMPFKLGAFAVAASTGTPIVPVVIRGTRSILRSGQWFPRHGRITVSIAAAVAPRGGDLMEAARLREAVRATMLRLCGEPDLGPPAPFG